MLHTTTLTTFNGKGVMYLPKGNSSTAGVKWYQDTISASVLGLKTVYEDNLKLVDQILWDALVEKYASEEHITDLDLTGCFFFGVTIHDLAFHKVNFSHCRFSQCRFERLQFTDCDFHATFYVDCSYCTFSHCNFSESLICQTALSHSRLESCDLSNSRMRHCLFHLCTLEKNEFLEVQMDTVHIRGCNCMKNNVERLYVTMGGATGDEIKSHSQLIINALTA